MRAQLALATVATLIHLSVVALMFAAAIGKIVEFGTLEYIQHFTNWTWSLLSFFFLFTLPVHLFVANGVVDWKLDALAGFVALTFVPMWGIVCTVWLLVVFMLLSGSELLDALSMVVPISVIVLGNEVFHFMIVLMTLTLAIVIQRFLYYAYNWLFSHRVVHRNRRVFWALVLYQVLIGPAIPLLLYLAAFDPQVVYMTTMNLIAGGALALGALLISTSPFYLFLFAFFMGSAPLDRRFPGESEFEALADRLSVSYAKAK